MTEKQFNDLMKQLERLVVGFEQMAEANRQLAQVIHKLESTPQRLVKK